jgi:hypothetical protein
MKYDIAELNANIEDVKQLVYEARKLEDLVQELEGPLTDEQIAHLELEFLCMTDIGTRPLRDVIERIDNALHHPETY